MDNEYGIALGSLRFAGILLADLQLAQGVYQGLGIQPFKHRINPAEGLD
jgi:hypothetical protein